MKYDLISGEDHPNSCFIIIHDIVEAQHSVNQYGKYLSLLCNVSTRAKQMFTVKVVGVLSFKVAGIFFGRYFFRPPQQKIVPPCNWMMFPGVFLGWPQMSGQFFEERPFTAEFLEASIQVVKRVGFHPTPKMADDLKPKREFQVK